MNGRYGDGWYSLSIIHITTIYDTVPFKLYLGGRKEEVFPLSLYMPIKKAAEWKFANGAGSGWTANNFDDSSWVGYTPGGSITTTGTQYFRKAFTGVTTSAAVEITVRYQQGILIHLNGNEVFRDNMATGEVSSSTTETGQYSSNDYRRVIARGNNLASSSVVAIEIHHLTTSVTTCNFDAFVSLFASMTISDNHSMCC